MIFDQAIFFNAVRGPLFAGHLSAGQVIGMTAILNGWPAHSDGDNRKLAYCLATTFHETGQEMQPVREWGLGRGLEYGEPDPETGHVYYGRGLVQLTWKANYEKMGNLIGVDLVSNPDLALDPAHAVTIMFTGMFGGYFTGRKLDDFFRGPTNNAVNARRIINGQDKAALIASYHVHFLDALTAAVVAAVPNQLAVMADPSTVETA